MNIELRKLKVSRSLSEETTAYTADLYVNGKKAATCSNHGQGSGDDIWWEDKAAWNTFKTHDRALAVAHLEKKHPGRAYIILNDRFTPAPAQA